MPKAHIPPLSTIENKYQTEQKFEYRQLLPQSLIKSFSNITFNQSSDWPNIILFNIWPIGCFKNAKTLGQHTIGTWLELQLPM